MLFIFTINGCFSTSKGVHVLECADNQFHYVLYILNISRQITCPKIIGDVYLWGKTSNDNNKQEHNNHNFKCLYSMFTDHRICIVL